jgi:protein arginine N-methyltransferase 2
MSVSEQLQAGGEEADLDIQTQQVLLAAAHHDAEALRGLLKTIPATVQDEETGYTPLHAAIAACAPEETQSNGTNAITESSASEEHDEMLKQAEKTMRLLFQNGAIVRSGLLQMKHNLIMC